VVGAAFRLLRADICPARSLLSAEAMREAVYHAACRGVRCRRPAAGAHGKNAYMLQLCASVPCDVLMLGSSRQQRAPRRAARGAGEAVRVPARAALARAEKRSAQQRAWCMRHAMAPDMCSVPAPVRSVPPPLSAVLERLRQRQFVRIFSSVAVC